MHPSAHLDLPTSYEIVLRTFKCRGGSNWNAAARTALSPSLEGIAIVVSSCLSLKKDVFYSGMDHNRSFNQYVS
jgi:hypothetical protein